MMVLGLIESVALFVMIFIIVTLSKLGAVLLQPVRTPGSGFGAKFNPQIASRENRFESSLPHGRENK
jgi:hypothetical protein